ncbi:Disease resistance protein RPP8 [Hibiscus syriacus]|uniref:Disease resistance protein RPP8 n=1 Tax=Hibiscus syriacus TaxID=106335 RepID=A0A6A3BM30_HIBSY|nr:Disease resistance protein RPP8 [Hibiscus syriacus]
MADAIGLVVEKISDLLINEALFLKDVKEQVSILKDELKCMKSFLEDVDRQQAQDKLLRDRVSKIRDLVYDAEDVIDSFILEHPHQDEFLKEARRGFFHAVVKRFTCIFTKPSHLHKTGVEIKKFQTNLENISRRLSVYKIPGDGAGSSSISSMQQQLRRTFSHVEEEDVVSLEVSTKDVLAQLMKEEDRSHAVVSIVGMGGIGKTTLAKKVYKHVDVNRRFDCLAWVFISQQCNPREVLLDVLMKVQPGGESFNHLNENQLIKKLYDALKEKQYLVVLDDIWRSEDWGILKPAFPRGKKGSKILFTTRNKDVALYADPWHSPIELPILTDDESWKLFITKASPRNKTDNHACPKAFENLGREMVKKCGGLPLAIVVLGGLLATKQTQDQWEMVHRKIFQGPLKGLQPQGHQYGAVNEILVLSYNDLPHRLKPCFLYLGHYPEDWEISKKELIRLWIAEDFISPSPESTEMLMEDEGEQILDELMNRSLVQLGRRDSTGRKVKTCRIHDLLRDLCIDKAREENFFEIVKPPSTEADVTLTESMLRRIAIHPSKRYVCVKGKHPKLRSLLLFQNEELIKLHISECKNFKFLRVLNLVRMDVKVWSVSSEIGNLRQLRYLKLQGEGIILPQDIGMLKSLYTLYLRHSGSVVIPDVAFELEHLRHIELRSESWKGTSHMRPRLIPKSIETLKDIRVDEELIRNKSLPRLSNLQSLGMTFNRAKDVKPVLLSLMKLQRLASLYIKFKQGLTPSYPDLEPLSQCHRLSKLKFDGFMKKDPQGSHHVLKFLPQNIVKLSLTNCWMNQDPMGVLEKLPCLRILKLGSRSYSGSQMICSANGFPQLDSLKMYDLLFLSSWKIEEGAMPQLRSLCVEETSNLIKIPEGLKYIFTLQELKLEGSFGVVEGIKVMDGREDFYKVHRPPCFYDDL